MQYSDHVVHLFILGFTCSLFRLFGLLLFFALRGFASVPVGPSK